MESTELNEAVNKFPETLPNYLLFVDFIFWYQSVTGQFDQACSSLNGFKVAMIGAYINL